MQIPGYISKHLIAEGGMASVYLAVQESLDRRVALKLLKKIDDPIHSERFLNEGRVIASLNHHNIITIYDIGIVKGCHYISMEFLEGGDLEHRIKQGLSADDALDLVETLGDCLGFIHENDIVHRDIKPANILFHKDGTLILTDFGVAKRKEVDASLTRDNIALGSPYYLSPEQAEGKEVDGRSDIYSLGVILFEMLTGHKPYDKKSYMETIVAHLTEAIPQLPAQLSIYQELIEKMMAKRPEDRFPSARSLVAYVRKLRQQLKSDGSSATPVSSGVRQTIFSVMAGLKQSLKGHTDNSISYCRKQFSIPDKEGVERVKKYWKIYSKSLSVYLKGPVDWVRKNLEQLSKGQQLILLVVAIFMVLFALTFALPSSNKPVAQQQDQSLEIPKRAVQAEDQTTAPESVKEQVATGSQNEVVVPEIVPEVGAPRRLSEKPPTPSAKTRQEVIAAYLESADLALRELRLRVPQGNSAYDYYRKILELDSGNMDARKVIARIGDKYADLVLREMENRDFEKAELYLKRGLEIQPQNQRLQDIEAERQAYLRKKRGGSDSRPTGFFDKLKAIFN